MSEPRPKPKPKRKRGPVSDVERVARMRRNASPDVAREISLTIVELMRGIRRDIATLDPIARISYARILVDWHTDYASVQMAGGVPEPVAPKEPAE